MKMRVIFAEMNTSWVVMKLKLNKNHACTGVEPMTSAVTVQCSTNWANKPTESWSFCWFAKNPWSDKRTSVIIYEYCLFELPHYWQWLGLMTFLVIPSGNSIIQWKSHTNVTKYGTSLPYKLFLYMVLSALYYLPVSYEESAKLQWSWQTSPYTRVSYTNSY